MEDGAKTLFTSDRVRVVANLFTDPIARVGKLANLEGYDLYKFKITNLYSYAAKAKAMLEEIAHDLEMKESKIPKIEVVVHP